MVPYQAQAVAHDFDIQETTIQIDHTNKTVSFYTTRRSVFLALVHRNPGFTKATELNPGYEVDYPLKECRAADGFVRLVEGSARDRFLTEGERTRFAESRVRLEAARSASKAETP